jgi:hypothetical protein
VSDEKNKNKLHHHNKRTETMTIIVFNTHSDEFYTTVSEDFLKGNGARKVQKVSTGEFHTILLLDDGSLWGFGVCVNGRLGIDATAQPGEVNIPTQLPQFWNTKTTSIIDFACGGYHSVFLDEQGYVYVCGKASEGACGINHQRQDLLVPTKWKSNEHVEIVGKVKKVQAGGHQTICLTTDGEVWTNGQNTFSQCGREIHTSHLFVPGQVSFDHLKEDIFINDIDTSYYHTVCLMNHTQKSPQRVFVFGNYIHSAKETIPVEIELPFTGTISSIGTGIQFSCFSLVNGQHYSMVQSSYVDSRHAQAGILATEQHLPFSDQTKHFSYWFYPSFTEESNIFSLSCGFYHSTVVTMDGRIVFYGRNLMQRRTHEGNESIRLDFTEILQRKQDRSYNNTRFTLAASGHMKAFVLSADICNSGLKPFGWFMFENMKYFARGYSDKFVDVELVYTQ